MKIVLHGSVALFEGNRSCSFLRRGNQRLDEEQAVRGIDLLLFLLPSGRSQVVNILGFGRMAPLCSHGGLIFVAASVHFTQPSVKAMYQYDR
jgi:hypothetical protein